MKDSPDPTGSATGSRAAIKADADKLALRMSHAAEALLCGSHRLRDASIQGHGEAAAQIGAAMRALKGLEDEVRKNALRWREVPRG